jgi:predicted kinase
VPVLILLNGPPASGKSTLARRYVDEHPLALNLDIDQVRDMLGRWPDDWHRAGLAARELAAAMAGTHLAGGHDVIVAQYFGRPEFIERLAAVAAGAGGRFRELVLLVDQAETLRRFHQRPAEDQAVKLLDQLGGLPELDAMRSRLEEMIADRPDVTVLRREAEPIDRTYQALLAVLAGP